MKLSRILPLVVGGAVAGIVVSGASPAQALNFNFSIVHNESQYPNGVPGGTITGTIYGLADNSTGAASDVIINSLPANFSTLPSAPFSVFSLGTLSENSFTVTNGNIVAANFTISPTTSTFQAFVLNSTIYGGANGLQADSTYVLTNGFAGVTYTPVSTPVPFDIPGSATIPTVGSLLALGAMRKAKKRLAAKTLVVNPVQTVVS